MTDRRTAESGCPVSGPKPAAVALGTKWESRALAQRRTRRGRPGSPSSTLSAPNPPARSPYAQRQGDHGTLPGPAMRAGVNCESAAADAVMAHGDGSRWDECRPLTAAPRPSPAPWHPADVIDQHIDGTHTHPAAG